MYQQRGGKEGVFSPIALYVILLMLHYLKILKRLVMTENLQPMIGLGINNPNDSIF